MILKSLTLQGFKSFPERTVIRFHEGVTAIVGPNGSGKSNVTDAIRWVLGEQSVRTLRTSKMEELIFSGTETRRPLSYAEVTLTMDNSDRTLPVDFPEVRVSRRIYRSGESEYLLNDSRCRLKDINELFLDTGIGRDGYSMIGQGRVDDILSGKAELRRKMLDEASGITKYKLRKEEADKKLAHTEQNLLRLNDILQEIEKQKSPLERQAKKANAYLRLRDELKGLDLALLYYEIDHKEADVKRFTQELAELTANTEEAEAQKSRILEENARQREAMQESGEILRTLQLEENEIKAEINQFEQNQALALQQLEQIAARKVRYMSQNKELEGRQAELLSEENAKAQEYEELEALGEAAKHDLTLHEHNYQQAIRDRQSSFLLQQALEDEENQTRSSLQDLQQQIREEQTNQEVLRTHLEMLERDLLAVDSELDQDENESNRLAEQHSQLKTETLALRKQSQELDRSREEQRLTLSETEQALRTTEQRIHNLQYQQQMQAELAESYEGYSYPVKHLMEWTKGSKQGVYGPLADLLQVPQEFEAAIESILGATAQHIVVADEDVARNMIQTLKEKRWGRATFLPLNRVQGSAPQDALLNTVRRMPGYRGIASELVEYKAAIGSAVDYALGRTIVADTLDQAVAMAKASSFRLRIASLDGDLLNPGGSMSGGSRKQQSSGILGRQRLLEDLAREIQAAQELADKQHSAMDRGKAELTATEAALTALAESLSRLSHDEVLLNSHISQYEQNRVRLQSKLEQNQADIKRLSKEKTDSAQGLAANLSKEQEKKEGLEQILLQRRQLTARLELENERVGDLAEIRSRHNENLIKNRERSSTAWQILQRVRMELASLREEITAQQLDREKDSSEEDRLTGLVRGGSGAKERLVAQLQEITEKIAETESRRHDAEESLAESSKAMDTISGYLTKLGQEQGRLEQRLENAGNQLMDQRARLWEEYSCTFANREEWYRTDLDQVKVREEVKSLRQQIRDLGAVNVQAIEESRELNERFAFMEQQKADIVSAQKDLAKIIADIKDGMYKQFKDSFQFINEQFRVVFRELFGGGEAELVLEDRSDILNSPIDIKVMPPGKRLQNMLALSGGERCLTAIALLFAIQKLNPSPFCVLDEVEAALDESNIFRFTDYIKANSSATQYILVTHRRGTMESARMMYGVTMQERGVSQVISIRLDE